ncbi:hypothetical protein TL16_g10962 [Triparma laevis f. inornata]|uniref:AAA+ ATPase domain-containing protein n=1 Tax=Triparma laevis f. inornata TaxID=1714386 RepID=A0A9W7BH28_9STRA|nr:hypothetical protein TL16_g10962 [Triparma laevis f. inornata]
MVTRSSPVSEATLVGMQKIGNFATQILSNPRYVTFNSNANLYELIIDYVSKDIPGAAFTAAKRQVTPAEAEKNKQSLTELKCDLGSFIVTIFGKPVIFHHETVGDVVSTDCTGPTFYQQLTLIAEGANGLNAITKLTDELIEKAEKVDPNMIKLYRWHIRHQYWRRASTIQGRTIESVILPAATKKKVLDDVTEFLGDDVKEFYQSHGVPFRRSYLFHGVPGAGKTSLVQGLATKFKRNICFIQPTHPEMTDDDLQLGMQKVPKNSILVLEDIDSLFEKNRNSKNARSSLTFTGLLNALDGVGSSTGQIIILTTNFRDQLDAALIRNGRVDAQIEFKNVNEEQAKLMFKRYYPMEEDDAISDTFAKDLMAKLEERSEGVASCGLQHFFVVNRKNNASEALARINMIFEEIDSRKAEKEDLKKDAEKEKKKAKNDEGSDDEDDDEERRPKKRGGRDEDANKDVSSGYSAENLTRLSLLTVQVALVTTCAMVVSSALKSLPKSR